MPRLFLSLPCFPLLADDATSVDNFTFLKWVAVTAMVMGLINSVLWVVYLIKEINHRKTEAATQEDLDDLEKRTMDKLHESAGRFEKMERVHETHMQKIYDTMRHEAENLTRVLQTMASDLGRVQGAMDKRRTA